MFLDLIQNVALLITLSALYGLAIRYRDRNPLVWKVTTGFWFGLTAIFGMMMPFVYQTGIIYDGRSIILALAGLFGGIIPSVIAFVMALIYRIAIGGPGEYAGVATIFFCTLAGLLFRYLYQLRTDRLDIPKLLIAGVAVHILMLGSQLLVPWPAGLQIIKNIWLPIMIIFPSAFVIIGRIMSAEERRLIREKEIREEESLIRTTLYSIGEGVITVDVENRILNINTVAESLTGWKEKEAYLLPVQEVFKISGESPEVILSSREGKEIPIQHTSSFIRDEHGKNLGKILVFRDQTAEHVRQKDLREKNDFIQTVLDNLPIGVALNKINEGTALYMNRQFQQIYGWPEEDLLDVAGFFEKVYPNAAYREQIITRIMTDIQSGDPSRMHWEDIEITRQDRTKAIVNAVNIPLFQQNIMVSTVMDVTEQKKAEIALRESEEKFRTLFENHLAVHLLIDPETRTIENVNKAATEFYGWTYDQLVGMRVDQINTLSAEEVNSALERAVTKPHNYYEFQHRLANGDIRNVEVYSSKVEIMGKTYLHSIVHDITEKKLLLKELIKAKEKAEENDMLKSAFLANMSHEIRTPLNGILGFTELITEEEDLPSAKRKHYSSIINRSAGSLMQIIDDILDLSKLETGQLAVNLSESKIQQILEDLKVMFDRKRRDLDLHEVSLILVNDFPGLTINTDRNRLIQIFSNLLDNALKFTSQGTISFGVKRDLGSTLELFVADTGIGIPREKHEVIFDRFTQAGRDIAKTYGGTGLGLSIVKKLLTLLGGTISVDSEPHKGTTFTFTLPK